MYTLNSSPRAQPLPAQLSRPDTSISANASSTKTSPTSPQFPPDQQQQAAAQAASEHFKSSLLTHIARLPSQPSSLPPSFITSFVRRCFPPELAKVDFAQALTGLDYLQNLETRRRKEIASALRRLGIERNTLGTERDEVSKKYPGVASWVKSIEEKERKVEALYTQVYIGLRRWTLINEMSLLPFSKPNCIAMLNTLYPPSTATQPTPQLTSTILHSQRQGFFRYIQGVEKNGPKILDNLMEQGRRPDRGDENGWIGVRETLDSYLRTANGVIDECSEVAGVDNLISETEEQKRKGRKVDSGVSFATGDRPSTSSSSSNSNNSTKDKPLPPSPVTTPSKSGSTLEKIAREIRKMRSRRQVDEIVKKEEKAKVKSLKKMKSASALGDLRQKNSSATSIAGVSIGAQTPAFDMDEMRRERLLYEARANRAGSKNQVMSFEV
ncbi:MAG: hypothetical protein M1827_001687 [Pycnora praestabilis]|nr:MAG: hypothetical protein M1827_001687 [Pycnora praestabilis]